MRQTIRLGRVAGIPVGSHWSVLVIMLLLVQVLALTVLPRSAPGEPAALYWAVAVIVAVLFMAALLGHELGHSLVARHYGVRVRGITLWLLGGVSELDGQAPHARGDLLIALAGPLVSVAAGGVFAGLTVTLALLGADALAVAALAWLAIVNFILAVFNLLPGAPLDGGRVLAALLWWTGTDRLAARRIASRAGMVLGGLLVVGGLAQLLLLGSLGGLWLALIGWFLITAAGAENADARLRNTLADLRVRDVMTTPARSGYANHSVAEFVDTVVRSHPHRSYPVVDATGTLTGVVTLANLGRVPDPQRQAVRLADVQTPRDRLTVLDPDTPLVDVALQLLAGGHRLAPVIEGGSLVAVVCGGDVSRATELAALRATPARTASG